MKHFLVYAVSVLNSLILQAQVKNNVCDSIKYEIIENNFIVELNASSIYYSSLDAILQQNNFFIGTDINKKNLPRIYNSDTILLKFWDEGIQYYYDKKCIDINSISQFNSNIDIGRLSKKKARKIKRNIFVDKNNVLYLRIHAKLKTINVGEHNWLIPKIYGINCVSNSIFDTYCERKFKTTMIISQIIEWNFIR